MGRKKRKAREPEVWQTAMVGTRVDVMPSQTHGVSKTRRAERRKQKQRLRKGEYE